MTNSANWEKIEWSGLLWQIEQYAEEIGQADISTVLHNIYCGGNDYWGHEKDGMVCAEKYCKGYG